MKLFDELEKYCNNNGIRLQIDVFRKDKNRYELTLDNFSPEELKDIRNIISDYAKIEDDVYLARNGRAIDIYFETLDESKTSARKSIKESINANSILSKVEAIVGKTKIQHPRAEIIELDGTKYIYYSYFDRGFDDDGLDMVWDKCSDLKGVVDVGFGYGYGLENTKYEDSLLIELDDDVIVESKKSARKSIEESKDITIEEFIGDYKNNDCFSIRDKENGHESECFWGSKKDVLDSDYRLFTVLGTDVNKETDDIILYIDLEENAWVESKKSARKSIKESLSIKDYCVEVYGDWFKEFYSDFDEFKNDLLYLSEGKNEDVLPFTYDIIPYGESAYVINTENDYGDKKQITFVLIPKSNKVTAKELNNLLH